MKLKTNYLAESEINRYNDVEFDGQKAITENGNINYDFMKGRTVKNNRTNDLGIVQGVYVGNDGFKIRFKVRNTRTGGVSDWYIESCSAIEEVYKSIVTVE